MQRIKSIDILRGLSIGWMILGHLAHWWIRDEDFWFADWLHKIIDPIGASCFIFIAGVSTAISYRNRMEKVTQGENDYNHKDVRNEYMLRAFIILVLALIYNTSIALVINNFLDIWKWFVLLTVAISLFLAWPLLKTSKLVRIILCFVIWIFNYFLLQILLPYREQLNFNGFFFHVLYNSLDQDNILSFFPFFLIGSCLGDILFDLYLIKDQDLKKTELRRKFSFPSFLIGASLILFGLLFQFPNFLIRVSLSWLFYTLGILILLLGILIHIESQNKLQREKSYKFFFYFSYYSLTIYLAHNVLYFIFLKQLNIPFFLIFTFITFIILNFILKIVYIKWGSNASIKMQIGRMAVASARKIKTKRISLELVKDVKLEHEN